MYHLTSLSTPGRLRGAPLTCHWLYNTERPLSIRTNKTISGAIQRRVRLAQTAVSLFNELLELPFSAQMFPRARLRPVQHRRLRRIAGTSPSHICRSWGRQAGDAHSYQGLTMDFHISYSACVCVLCPKKVGSRTI